MTKRRFLLDVESASPVDLKKAGAHAYWEHPDTRVLCVSYRVDDGPIVRWRPGDPTPYFAQELHQGGFRVVAHNYLFEFWAWRFKLGPVWGWGECPAIPRWDCTMARALYWGLPASLDDVGDALHLPVVKDKEARPIMLRLSRPRSQNPDGSYVWWHETDPDKFERLQSYCDQDVEVEGLVDDALPALPDRERRIFDMDGLINFRGIAIDTNMIGILNGLTGSEGRRLNADMARLTGRPGTTTNQVKVIGEVLTGLGFPVPDLTKATVAEYIKGAERVVALQRDNDALGSPAHIDPGALAQAIAARDILRTRQEAAKASTAKLAAMTAGASKDNRCRGLFQYAGAGRTLRWAGRRVQTQNYPRGVLKALDELFRFLERVPRITAEELTPLIPCSVMDACSSMLRGCLIADDLMTLVAVDKAQIEARVLSWLAGQKDILAVFAAGKDVYTHTANGIGSSDRQLGKVLVLACGFGMGPDKFQESAAAYGLTLSAEQSEDAVEAWRKLNHKIVSFWWDVDRAAKLVAQSPHGATAYVGRVVFTKTRKAMRITLPSGSQLTYQNVEVGVDAFGREALSYMGVEPTSKKWLRIRTYGGRLVENITQATARDVLADDLLRVEKEVPTAFTVGTAHDEGIFETVGGEIEGNVVLKKVLAVMRKPPTWAPDLPVWAEGWTGKRYRK